MASFATTQTYMYTQYRVSYWWDGDYNNLYFFTSNQTNKTRPNLINKCCGLQSCLWVISHKTECSTVRCQTNAILSLLFFNTHILKVKTIWTRWHVESLVNLEFWRYSLFGNKKNTFLESLGKHIFLRTNILRIFKFEFKL